jgi:hypothetical protein
LANLYVATSSAFQTTAAPALVATGTAIKTLQQLTCPAGEDIRIVEWGVSLDAPAAAGRVLVELVDTGAIAGGSPTAQTPQGYNDLNAPASQITAGFQPTTEGSIVAGRYYDHAIVVPPYVYKWPFPLGREPAIAVSRVLRVRVTATQTCNAHSYIVWEE